ncbi:MAG: hypothetical protein WCW03_02335 [Candidatus Paceibacterota bacterium]|jgi:hypothetical protein
MIRIYNKGDILVSVLVFSAIAITITIGLVNWGSILLKSVRTLADKGQALQIAEAGIDYYRWHLAHMPEDFMDGTGQTGPYIHEFKDKDGNLIGTYTLTITPPSIGSTVVTIVSKGALNSNPNITRSIKAILAIPSWAQYASVANDNMRFGSGTVIYGPVHSNKGIHFDGITYGLMSSALTTYVDPDYGANRWAVYTLTSPSDPNPPTPLPLKPNIFTAGRKISVPAVDFTGLTANLAQLRTLAQSNGIYLSQSQYKGKSALGYHITLKTNDTFDVRVVTAINNPPNSSCWNLLNQNQWSTWSIKTEQSAVNYPIPTNGIIFVEDNVWVDGQINTARLTIAAGKLPDPGASKWSNIIINNDILYTNHDGNDVIGLIAQGDVNIGLSSANSLDIDAALVAQNGRVGRNYYSYYCGSSYIRSDINLYGMIATNQRYGFAYTDDTGYRDRNISYDPNLLYSPPPSFPLTSSYYSTLSWQEIN